MQTLPEAKQQPFQPFGADLDERVMRMFFSNVFQRRVHDIATCPKYIMTGESLTKEQFDALYKQISDSATKTVCLTSGTLIVRKVVGLAVLDGKNIAVLRNPSNKSTDASILTTIPCKTLQMQDVLIDPLAYWQQRIEPIAEKQYSFE